VVGAWDAYSHLGCLIDKTRSRRRMLRMFVGGTLVPGFWCASRLFSILLVAAAGILESDRALRHKPEEGSVSTTDDQPVLDSAGRFSPVA
jgi:hypothetical protein